MLVFKQLFDVESSTYTYLLGDSQLGVAVFIDPVLEGVEGYLKLLSELELKLVYAVDTHVHADHITALGELRTHTGCQTIMGEQSSAKCVSMTCKHGDVISVGSIDLNVIYTPGHTDDSYSFYVEDKARAMLFTGDTLLIRGTGRTDFQHGDARVQYQSLFERLLCFADETQVYPGHDYNGRTVSTIAEEKQHNPRLQVAGVEEYVTLMDSLNLPSPKLMDVAVSANQACGDFTKMGLAGLDQN